MEGGAERLFSGGLLGALLRLPGLKLTATAIMIAVAVNFPRFGTDLAAVGPAWFLLEWSSANGDDFGSAVYEETTVTEAESRAAFHILEPSVLPSDYHLASVTVPRQSVDPQFRLIYTHRVAPVRDLLLVESVPSSETEKHLMLVRGGGEPFNISGQAAMYFGGLLNESRTQSGWRSGVDSVGNGVSAERAGILVQVFGWTDAGVDRTMLERIVASLR